MAADLTPLLSDWPHDSADESRNVRCIRGADGRLKIQVRVRCGIFQWEYEGRPDGATPRGFPSLLDFYRAHLKSLDRRRAGATLRLGKAEVEEISEEIMDYYQRRILFFRLGEYARAREDADHNVALMDLIREHAADPELAAQHEKWRGFVLMDRTRADALVLCQAGNHARAIQRVEQGIAELEDWFRRQEREDLIPVSQEIAALREFKLQLRETYNVPLSRKEVIEGLREEQAKAIADEDYERAARLRDEIAQYERDEEQKAT